MSLWLLLACGGPDSGAAPPATESGADTPEGTADGDGDGYGDDDCNDADAAVSPGAEEVCNGVDDDCDGRIDFDNDVPEDRPTIQNAIYEAEDGDVLCVAAGTYTESLDFQGRSVRVVAWQGPDLTVLDAAGDYTAVVVQWGEVVAIEGLSIVGASQTGVRVEASTLSLTSVRVTGHSCAEYYGCSGIGLLASDATLVLEDVEISGNVGTPGAGGSFGAGAYLSGTEATWTRVVVSGNQASAGSEGWVAGVGVYVAGGHLDAENLIVAGNVDTSAWGYAAGGGVYVDGEAEVRLSHASIVGNLLPDEASGGGLAVVNGAIVELSQSVVSHNVAGAGGAAVAALDEANAVSFAWDDIYGNVGASVVSGVDEPAPGDGNFAADPIYLDSSAASAADWDLHPGAGSALIDAGDPAELDAEGTRSDVGAFGGPSGAW